MEILPALHEEGKTIVIATHDPFVFEHPLIGKTVAMHDGRITGVTVQVILHPGILALLAGSTIVLAMMLYASGLGVQILRRWDFSSSSERQLTLERKTYLVSTLIHYALGFEVISGLLFIYTLDEIHPLFVGAMCATGSLNANPIGWQALYVKMAMFFAASLWMVLNRLDQSAEDYPLVRPKYGALLFLTYLVALDVYYQYAYFLGLSPSVITSCCGSLFSATGTHLAAGLSGLPAQPMMAALYGVGAFFLATGIWSLKSAAALPRALFSLAGAGFFFVAIAAIISYICLYIYEMPTHHCPFDILQRHYAFIGYPIYLTLFGAALFALFPGVFLPLRRRRALAAALALKERRWILLALLFMLAFLALATWPVVAGHFTLAGYP